MATSEYRARTGWPGVWTLLAVLCGLFAATLPAGAKITVVATTNIVADAVRNVAGDAAEVVSLMGPGVDPHLYNATQGDLRRLSQAGVIFYNGLNLEGRLEPILEQMKRRVPTFAVTEYMTHDELLADPVYGTYDPHVWFDVPLWVKAVERIRDALAAVDPVNADVYRANAARFAAELAALHEEVEQILAVLPPERRVLVTAHDAFGYFGRRYGFEVVGLQGLSTDAEYGLADVRALVTLLVERDIRAVFVETSVATHGIQAVVAGAAAQGHRVEIGGELYSDALGAPGTPGGTYAGMIRHNVETIVQALAGARP